MFPIPPDAMLVPMYLVRPERAWRYATLCTVASVAGTVLGYASGLYLFEAVAHPILAICSHAEALQSFRGWFARWGRR